MTGSLAVPAPSDSKAAPRARQEAFELKGTMASFTVLRLRSTDVGLVERQLRMKTAQLPGLFLDAPVLVDLAPLGEQAAALALAELVAAIRACKMVPVAASNVPEELRGAVSDAGLGVWRPSAPGRARPELPDPAEAPAAEPALLAAPAIRAPHAGPVVVTKPVRSGQVVHAHDNDLVVLAAVNPGAQVIADGHLHVYAPMRGRAVAGAQGLPGARIFCQKLEAELVAISDAYMMADEIPAQMRGRAVQIYLEDGECRFAPL